MNMKRTLVCKFGLAMLGIVALLHTATAQPFAYTNNDLLLGFRKTGSFKESYEVVVNIGKATNYAQASAGTSFAVPNFTLSQLTPGSFANLNHLNWSVFGFSKTNLSNVLPGYVNNTLWLTVPRSNPAIQTGPPTRLIYASQNTVGTQIATIELNAAYLSSQSKAAPTLHSSGVTPHTELRGIAPRTLRALSPPLPPAAEQQSPESWKRSDRPFCRLK